MAFISILFLDIVLWAMLFFGVLLLIAGIVLLIVGIKLRKSGKEKNGNICVIIGAAFIAAVIVAALCFFL